MAREEFKTTLETQSKVDLKVLAAIERKDMNELLEELIEERKQKRATTQREAL